MESVWDYPRPPTLVPSERHVRVELAGHVVAESTGALRVLETASPPTVYVPPADVARELLQNTSGHSVCEWKGHAHYADVVVGGHRARCAAWWYPEPVAAYAALRDHVAFYPGRVACFLDQERVRPQDGDFYGGWVSDDIAGPFKGATGTLHW
jgi:uncharacterized protein (DUF427 family)